MAKKIIFGKAKTQPKGKKQTGGKKATLNKLNSFLKDAEQKTVEILVNNLHAQGNSVTYKELRESYLAGGLTEKQFTNWQKKYSKLVKDALVPEWEEAAALAAQEQKDKYPYFLYEPGKGAAAEWIKQHGAELVTNLAHEQIDALNAIISHVSGYTAITPDEAARIMRPCIGLTKPQAVANARYREKVKEAYIKAHPKGKTETAEKKAQEAAARYAARQHRYRAQSIARTELAYGYNAGAYGATKDAQEQGYIGDCIKTWITAFDERVCKYCSPMDNEKKPMDEAFSNGVMIPPGHPQCRCAVAYEEIEGTNINPQPPQQATQQAQPQAAAPAPGSPSIPPDIEKPDYQMEYQNDINLGGTGKMELYKDENGDEWLFKPVQTKSGVPEQFRVYAQEAGYKVQGIVDPDTAVQVGTGTLDGEFGAYQRRLNTLDSGGWKQWQKGGVYGWEDSDLRPETLQQFQREHTTDWLLGNFDSHGGNFVTDTSGRIIGIDKEQAFKYITDKKSHTMSYTYHPNAAYGETEPIYNTMFRKYAKGEIDLDLNDSLKYIQRVEQIPDSEYREIFREYAESRYGAGQQAEDLLDSIVNRKSDLRETYRAFYSELETERTGVKTAFKFSDELAGTAKPKPVPKPKAPKKPKTPSVPQPTPTTPAAGMPIKTESGYKVTEMLDDISILPNTANGVAVRSDGTMVEQMNMTGRRIKMDSGLEYYEVSGKLTEDTWRAAVQNAKKRGYKSDLEFLMSDPATGNYINGDVAWRLDGYKIMDISQASFEVFAGTDEAGMQGFFRARVPVGADPKADAKVMETILDKVGLRPLASNPTPQDEQRLRKIRLAWQRDPKEWEKARHLTGAKQDAAVDKILRKHGITEARATAMEAKEVFSGYTTLVDNSATMEYRKAGLTHIWAGVGDENALVDIVTGDGFTTTNYRARNGLKKFGSGGASESSDVLTGGSDAVFTRIGVNATRPYEDSFLGGRYRVLIDPEELNRTDWWAYANDNYGNAKLDTAGTCASVGFADRQTPIEFIKAMKKDYRCGNEIMFPKGISSEKFIGVSVQDDNLRNKLLQKFKDRGVKEINGVPVEDFVQVSRRIGEDSARGVQGLSFYTNPF